MASAARVRETYMMPIRVGEHCTQRVLRVSMRSVAITRAVVHRPGLALISCPIGMWIPTLVCRGGSIYTSLAYEGLEVV